MKKYSIVVLFIFHFIISNAQWTQTNGPLAGKITCIDTLGTNIFAGTSFGQVFSSNDNGSNWTSVFTAPPLSVVLTLAVSGSEIFVGTSEGMYYSLDNGITWTQVTGVLYGPNIYSIVTSGSTIFAGTDDGVFLSTNNGNSWTKKIITGEPTTCMTTVLAMKDTNLFAATIFGLFRSINNGNTWTPSGSGLGGANITSIVVSGTNIYAGTLSGMFLSVDNGNSWAAINTGLTNTWVETVTTDGTNIFAGTNGGGLFLSNNGGSTWVAVNSGVFSNSISSVFTNGMSVFAGADNGIYISGDNGNNWTPNDAGLGTTVITSMAANGSSIFAGTDIKGVFRSVNNGDSWESVNIGLTGSYGITSLAVIDTNIYAVNGSKVFRSTNNGNNWTLSSIGLPSSGSINKLTVNGANLYVTTSSGLFLSTDYGNTWSLVYSGDNFDKIIFKGTNMFAYNQSLNVYLSTDNGNSWNSIYSGLYFSYINDIIAKGSDIFIAGDGFAGNNIYKTSDNGTTWIPIDTSGFTPFVHVVNSLLTNGTDIYAGMESGEIYLSSNNGATWTLNGNCSSFVNNLKMSGAIIYAGTGSGGVWRDTVNANVWPGDADNNYMVDNTDLLPVGLYYGQTGAPRASVSNLWQSFPASNWGTLESNGSDIKHADCNGDGIINANDTLAINMNFSLAHAFVSSGNNSRSINPDLYFVTSAGSYNAGDMVDVEIWGGTSTSPVAKLYGVAFDLSYDASFVQPGTETLTYPASWFGTSGVNTLKVGKVDPLAGIGYGAETRINHTNAHGYGKIADFKFRAKTIISSSSTMNFSIVNYEANDSAGAHVFFNPQPYSIFLNPFGVGVNELNNVSEIAIYPNPYQSATKISYSLSNKSSVSIEIFNTIGQKLETVINGDQQAGEYNYNFSAEKKGFNSGVYFVKFTINGKVTTKRIVEID